MFLCPYPPPHTHTSPLPCLLTSASLWSEKASIPMRCGLCWCLFETWGSGMLVGALSTIWSHSQISTERQSSSGRCRPLPLLPQTQWSIYFLLPHRAQILSSSALFTAWQITDPGPICCPNRSKRIRLPFHQKAASGFSWTKLKVFYIKQT